MRKYFCMECGKVYEDGNFPIIKEKSVDGCCCAGSLIELDYGRKRMLKNASVALQNGDITLKQLINLMRY